tara:strand:- start:956 stop:1342 length:387 start_codon:yes stop_codon:yes gene_type:complete
MMQTTISNIPSDEFSIIRNNLVESDEILPLSTLIERLNSLTLSPLYAKGGHNTETIRLDHELCSKEQLVFEGQARYVGCFVYTEDVRNGQFEVWVKNNSTLINILDGLINKNIGTEAYTKALFEFDNR